VFAHEGGQPSDVSVGDRVAGGPELFERCVDVDGVPQHDAVEDQAKGSELGLHAGVVALVELALAAVEYLLRQVVATFLEVADALDVAPVGLVVDEGEDVERLEDPPVVGDRLAQRGGVAVTLEHPDHVVGPYRPSVDRATTRTMSGQCLAILSRSSFPRAATSSGP